MMFSRRTLLIGAAATAATVTALPVFADAPLLRIGDQKGGAQPLMEAARVLSALPYRLEWSQFAGAPMLMEALNAGAIDAGSIGDAPFASGIASAIPMKAVSVTKSDGAVTALVVPSNSAVRTIADLKGRSIATLKGQTGHFLVLAALQKAGLKPEDVRFVFLSPSDAKAAMAAGSVDGWATWGPYIALAKVQDGAREIVNGRDLMSGQSYLVASDDAIANRRAPLSDFLRRLRIAREWGLQNPEAQARVWAQQTGFSYPVGKVVVDTAQTRTVAIEDPIIAAQQRVADFFHTAHVLPKPQTVAGFFDRSFNTAVFAT
ncbi:ABC transporter substrate-binding protein [Acidisphaera sp. L21]|uniref:ABC transporter substrate-binding protein n=1 Tax=Acidisphaera sp. L21 TaxID=1641851 RepID=UPI00131CF1D5|nr:ABC transporter substrate-binding protein [Acidisphaera sp. L21]